MEERGEKYKVEHIGDLPEDAVLSFYQQGEYIDMCVGPHLTYTKGLKAFKLTQLSGAYWKNDKNNIMLTRIGGTAFRTREELEDACANYEFQSYSFLKEDMLGKVNRMEGFLFPTTQAFDPEKTAVYDIDTMLTNFVSQFDDDMMADINASGYSLYEIVTMASIIEKEGIGDETERKNIASVLYNRMDNPDRGTYGYLQLDTTIYYALSLEGSLKLKEISYVHSDAYAAGELKHGTISLVTDGVPVIALATQKNVYEKTISNAKETRSRGARVLLFTTKDAEVPEGVATEVIRLDEYDDILMPLQLIVPLQLFAYYMAVLRGCDVDKPRNLAKSVTVE